MSCFPMCHNVDKLITHNNNPIKSLPFHYLLWYLMGKFVEAFNLLQRHDNMGQCYFYNY